MPKPDAVTTLALVKCISAEAESAARDRVKEGSYQVNQLIQLRGPLIVAPSVPAGPPSIEAAKFEPWLLLAIAISDRPDVVAALARRAAKATLKDKAAAEALQIQFLAHSAKLLDPIRKPGHGGRRGHVSFSGEVSVT